MIRNDSKVYFTTHVLFYSDISDKEKLKMASDGVKREFREKSVWNLGCKGEKIIKDEKSY